MKTREYTPGMSYGFGYNALSQDVRGQSIDVTKGASDPHTNNTNNPNRIHTVSKYVESNQELAKALDVSLTASLGIPGIGLSAKGKFISETNFSQHSLYFVVRITVTNTTKILNQPEVLPAAMRLLEYNGVDHFCRSYGQEFISGLVMGGEYFACLEIAATQNQDRKTIMAEIGVDIPIFNAMGGGKVSGSKRWEELNKKYAVNLISYQAGGSGMNFPQSFEEVNNEIKNFLATVNDNSVPYAAILSDYDSLGIPDLYMSISGDIELRKSRLEQLSERRLQYLQQLAAIEESLSSSPNNSNKENSKLKLRNAIEEITQQAQELVNNPNSSLPSELPIVHI
jgi:hypothetical protein